ncbi:MAG: peptidylprolyl isomerase [Saprospiraceae bacterium]|nr:peptidylprolyl isomerase [Saprospiraceae bacterium]
MRLILTLVFACFAWVVGSQQDPVLFTVAGKPVNLSEFEYIYNKNNGKDADYSKKSLEDYLNLYTKFKLKVHAARDMKVDTIPALIKELEGYRQQLTTSYLNDKEVTDKLAREVYERQRKDLLLNHILFSLSPNATGPDTVKSYNMAANAIRMINTGMKWADAAKNSNDLNSAQKNGRLGWFTSMFPDGFYNLENAAYAIQPGQVYPMPIRTRLGYHVLQVEAQRPAYRRMEIAHIFLKKSSRGNPDIIAQTKADSLYKLIKSGQNFEELARVNSDDKASAVQGGSIGYIGINQFEPAFEDAAFAITQDGEVAAPIESAIGWHIIKRLRKDDELPYERAKRKIQVDIQRDERFNVAQASLIEKIKSEAGYKENENTLNYFMANIDTLFYTYKWKIPEDLKNETIFNLSHQSFGLLDFAEYVKSNTRLRMQGGENKEVMGTLKNMLKEYSNQKCLQFEEGKLEEKYPDFKALMREYREGILLFEATKIVVWDRASEDTTGLKAFHQKNKDKYRWEERAMMLTVSVDTTDKDLVDQIYSFAKKNPIEKIFDKFDKDKKFISYQRTMVEKKGMDSYKGMSFSKNEASKLQLNQENTGYNFNKIEAIHPAGYKTLDEARGYIIADYQDNLEMMWVDELKRKYEVKVQQDVFNALIKS